MPFWIQHRINYFVIQYQVSTIIAALKSACYLNEVTDMNFMKLYNWIVYLRIVRFVNDTVYPLVGIYFIWSYTLLPFLRHLAIVFKLLKNTPEIVTQIPDVINNYLVLFTFWQNRIAPVFFCWPRRIPLWIHHVPGEPWAKPDLHRPKPLGCSFVSLMAESR